MVCVVKYFATVFLIYQFLIICCYATYTQLFPWSTQLSISSHPLTVQFDLLNTAAWANLNNVLESVSIRSKVPPSSPFERWRSRLVWSLYLGAVMWEMPHKLRRLNTSYQLVALSGEVEEAWCCWRNYVTVGRLWEFVGSPSFHFRLSASGLQLKIWILLLFIFPVAHCHASTLLWRIFMPLEP